MVMLFLHQEGIRLKSGAVPAAVNSKRLQPPKREAGVSSFEQHFATKVSTNSSYREELNFSFSERTRGASGRPFNNWSKPEDLPFRTTIFKAFGRKSLE
jgi:hypothetical protein